MSWCSGFPKRNHDSVSLTATMILQESPAISAPLDLWDVGFEVLVQILTVTTFVTVYGDIVMVIPLLIVGFLIV